MPISDLFQSPGSCFLSGVCVVSLVLAACVSPPGTGDANSAILSGTVTYLPRIALPPNAVVHVRLEDVSRADAPATTLTEQTIPTEGRQVPIPFTLEYDPERIETGHRYAVRAEIRDAGGDLLWTTDTMHPVLTSGAPSGSVEVRVVQTTESAGPGEMSSLVGPEWRLVRIETTAGATVVPDADEVYTITFGADGRYSGQADCNRYGGEFNAKPDGDLDLDRGLSTLAACPPPSASSEFFRVLNEVERYSVMGGQLTLDASVGGSLVFARKGATDTSGTPNTEATPGLGGMPPQPTGQTFVYACDDGGFEFTIRTGPGEIALWLPERFADREGGAYRVLGQVRAASGAKYQDGPVTVWTKGSTALLEIDSQTFTDCTEVAERAAGPVSAH